MRALVDSDLPFSLEIPSQKGMDFSLDHFLGAREWVFIRAWNKQGGWTFIREGHSRAGVSVLEPRPYLHCGDLQLKS